MAKIKILQGDITKIEVDAIVNAANKTLLGGGGVDGAIHRAAGNELLKECQTLGGCETGEAKITKGYKLPVKYVIHTVGPVWENGSHQEALLLANCYKNSLRLAEIHKVESISFPAISTGVYGFPMEKAAKIALQEIKGFSFQHIKEVILVCFDHATYSFYNDIEKNVSNTQIEYHNTYENSRKSILQRFLDFLLFK